MTKSKVILTAATFMLAIGSVFAASFSTIEPGYKFTSTNPVGEKCEFRKDCQIEPQPLVCRYISATENVPLFQLLDVDDCPVVLYEIEQ